MTMVDTVRLYRITITGWVAQDNLGGNFENFTPNCGDFETMVSMMVGVNVEEKLVDTIKEPGEDDPSTPWVRCMDHLIEELQTDGKDLPVGQRFEYGDVNTCWTCQDKGEESN